MVPRSAPICSTDPLGDWRRGIKRASICQVVGRQHSTCTRAKARTPCDGSPAKAHASPMPSYSHERTAGCTPKRCVSAIRRAASSRRKAFGPLHDQHARLERQFDTMSGELDTGRAILTQSCTCSTTPAAVRGSQDTSPESPQQGHLHQALRGRSRQRPSRGQRPTQRSFATVIYAWRAETSSEPSSVRQAALAVIREVEDHSDTTYWTGWRPN